MRSIVLAISALTCHMNQWIDHVESARRVHFDTATCMATRQLDQLFRRLQVPTPTNIKVASTEQCQLNQERHSLVSMVC